MNLVTPDGLTWREKLAYLAVRFAESDPVEIPINHSWKHGQYIREVFIPAGSMLIGSPHIHGHPCQLVSGKVTHIREHGTAEREAPFGIVTVPGCQMVIYAHTDTIGRTYHPDSGERDTQKCRDEHFVPAEVDLQIGKEVHARLDRNSYDRLIRDHSVDEEAWRRIYVSNSDMVPFIGDPKAQPGPSRIHGIGIIATGPIKAGEWICDARIMKFRTPAGRYTNHSHAPNAAPQRGSDRISLIAARPISKGAEVTIDYFNMRQLAQESA